MKVSISPYLLTPLKKANRLSTPEQKGGVYLKGELNGKILFADYFPHEALGDRPVEEFLQTFRYQDYEYDQKVFHFLLKDHLFQDGESKLFKNHLLRQEKVGDVDSPVVKYKLHSHDDFGFHSALRTGAILRLDANGLFTRNEFEEFLQQVPKDLLKNIEYIEDPLADLDWKNLGLPVARDFIKGSPFDFLIYKPNASFLKPTDKKVIFSSYLGADLGRWHAASELFTQGDLRLTHGIITEGFYKEELPLFTGSYRDGLQADTSVVKKMYQSLSQRKWTLLCSM
jgi:hypothetical protein